MQENTKQILIASGLILGTAVVGFILFKIIRRKMNVVYVEGEYKASNCDEFHAFQSTHGRIIGGMNDKIFTELEKMYKKGINPEVTDVIINMDANQMKVKWQVKIEPVLVQKFLKPK